MKAKAIVALMFGWLLVHPAAIGATEIAAVEAVRFDAGVRLYFQGRYDDALAEFTLGYELGKNSRFLLKMAETQRRLGHLEKAIELFSQFNRDEPRSSLAPSVRRTIAALEKERSAPEPAVLFPSKAPQEKLAPLHPSTRGRAAKIAAAVLGVNAVLLSAAAIYTWQQISTLENQAHAELENLSRINSPVSKEQSAFLQHPTCSPPPSLAGTEAYRSTCKNGETFSAATYALGALAASSALTGLASFLVGHHQAGAGATRLAIAPSIGPTGGQLQLALTF